MADVTISSLAITNNKESNLFQAGEALAIGEVAYLKSSDSKYYKSQSDGTSAEAAASVMAGSAASTGEYFLPLKSGQKVNISSGLSAGEIYVVSTTAGAIAPLADLAENTNEVQSVTVSGATSGTFTLTFDGQTTAAIDYNATAGDVETALEALSNIDAVSCTGGPLNSSAVSVEFQGDNAATDVAEMTATNSTDGTVSISTTTAGVTGNYVTRVGHATSSSVLELDFKAIGVRKA